MGKKLTFFILNYNGRPIKRFTVSKLLITFLLLGLITTLSYFSFIIKDYMQYKEASVNTDGILLTIDQQKDVISNQRQQIQKFAYEINVLKSNIITLNNFEKKLCIIANLENDPNQGESLFGIGGSIPADIDTAIELEEQHNGLIREMHDQVEQLSTAVVNQKKGFATLYDHLESQKNLLSSTPSIRPVKGRMTSKFGYRNSPFKSSKKKREFHKGLDFSNPKGTPILATADGIITYAKRKGSFGNMIMINHGYGISTRYAHCFKLIKNPGDRVKRGETIALVGNTGRSTASHLHYEVLLNGVQVNPIKYILN